MEEAGVPVCAPSANRFGHVSPTTAKHVLQDLVFEDVLVIQDDATCDDDLCCSVGIESTVVKVDPSNETLTVLRRGAVSPVDIRRQISEIGFDSWVVHCQDLHLSENEQQSQEAPGQLIRHYAPDVETFMIPLSDFTTLCPSSYIPPPGTVIIDCGAFLAYLRERQEIVGYSDLSPTGSAREAASTLFQKLRWAESIPGVKRIVIVQSRPDKSCDGMAEAINDRIIRAACGRVATMSNMYSRKQ